MNTVVIKIIVFGLSRREKGDEMPYLPLTLLVRPIFFLHSIPFSYVSFLFPMFLCENELFM